MVHKLSDQSTRSISLPDFKPFFFLLPLRPSSAQVVCSVHMRFIKWCPAKKRLFQDVPRPCCLTSAHI